MLEVKRRLVVIFFFGFGLCILAIAYAVGFLEVDRGVVITSLAYFALFFILLSCIALIYDIKNR